MTARGDSFSHAIVHFSEALRSPETDISRDAAIQRFEYCFELAWKVIQEQGPGKTARLSIAKGLTQTRIQEWLDQRRSSRQGCVSPPLRLSPPYAPLEYSLSSTIARSPPPALKKQPPPRLRATGRGHRALSTRRKRSIRQRRVPPVSPRTRQGRLPSY